MSRGASVRRREFRQSTGVNRKLCSTRWIGQATVRVVIFGTVRAKASEGAEKSLRSSRRSRRGQRRGKHRARGCHPRDRACRPSSTKELTPRRVNHSGRKILWSVKAVNRIIGRSDFKLLEKLAVPYFNEKKWLDKKLTNLPIWRHCNNVLSPFRRRAKAAGIPLQTCFERDLWTFIQVNSRHSYSGLRALLDLSDLPRREPSPVRGVPPPPSLVPRGRTIEVDGRTVILHAPSRVPFRTRANRRSGPGRGGQGRRFGDA
jgi:hypothetical protein